LIGVTGKPEEGRPAGGEELPAAGEELPVGFTPLENDLYFVSKPTNAELELAWFNAATHAPILWTYCLAACRSLNGRVKDTAILSAGSAGAIIG
jgi:hypothetical protein